MDLAKICRLEKWCIKLAKYISWLLFSIDDCIFAYPSDFLSFQVITYNFWYNVILQTRNYISTYLACRDNPNVNTEKTFSNTKQHKKNTKCNCQYIDDLKIFYLKDLSKDF